MTKTAILLHPDPIARAALRAKLETRYPCLAIAGEAADGARGEALIRQIKPDFAFVEAGLSGRPCFQALAKLDAKLLALHPPLSRLIAFAFRADWAEVFDYLLPPPASTAAAGDGQRPSAALRGPALRPDGASARGASPCPERLERGILLDDGKNIIAVPLKTLIRIEAQGRKAVFYIVGRPEPVVSPWGINAWAKVLEDVPFLFRSHRSHLINLMHFKQYTKSSGLLIMASPNGGNGTKAVLADNRREELWEAIARQGWWVIGGKGLA
jgi:two-component system LytT family response regulator